MGDQGSDSPLAPDTSTLEGIEAENKGQPSRDAIADAVASRLKSRGELTSNDAAKRQSEHKARIRKSINEITASVNYERSSACLRLTHILLENIRKHPSESKYRSFKATQPKISREILSLDEGKALLIEIGFRTRTIDFQREWFIPAEWNEECLGLKKVEWSCELIELKMQEFEENAERVRFNKNREKNYESTRKSRALEEAKEDRERVALRAERERVARKAIASRAETEKEEERVKQLEGEGTEDS
ncbi:hypothetical protein CBS101457_004483 [Exobasidium rhododendri]|nr:hypothetical protein CBS101457_004483 [Exobasidium rhododendri]